jgi:hypothetical protein
MDGLMETTGYWTLKVEALDRILLPTGFGRGYGLIARQAAERMKSLHPDACFPHNCCHILQLPRIYSAYPGHDHRTHYSCITGDTFRFGLWPRLLIKGILRSCRND